MCINLWCCANIVSKTKTTTNIESSTPTLLDSQALLLMHQTNQVMEALVCCKKAKKKGTKSMVRSSKNVSLTLLIWRYVPIQFQFKFSWFNQDIGGWETSSVTCYYYVLCSLMLMHSKILEDGTWAQLLICKICSMVMVHLHLHSIRYWTYWRMGC